MIIFCKLFKGLVLTLKALF